jgi:hypothetical protein
VNPGIPLNYRLGPQWYTNPFIIFKSHVELVPVQYFKFRGSRCKAGTGTPGLQNAQCAATNVSEH